MKVIKENLQITIVMTIINLFVLFNFIINGKMLHGIGYFIFFYVSIYCIYFFTKKNPPKNEIEVKNPKKELKISVLFTLLGILCITLNFYVKSLYPNLGFLVKIPILLSVLLFTYPLGIVFYLLIKKYKLIQFGLRINPIINLILGIFICGLTGLFAYIFNLNGILWQKGLEEYGGFFGILLQSVIGAALVEELSRFFIQSRFEKVFKLSGFHILFATTIWAFMHFPVSYYKDKEIYETLIYFIQIIPIGFVWGYLTHRTKSILPSVIVHGFNLWGFQNG